MDGISPKRQRRRYLPSLDQLGLEIPQFEFPAFSLPRVFLKIKWPRLRLPRLSQPKAKPVIKQTRTKQPSPPPPKAKPPQIKTAPAPATHALGVLARLDRTLDRMADALPTDFSFVKKRPIIVAFLIAGMGVTTWRTMGSDAAPVAELPSLSLQATPVVQTVSPPVQVETRFQVPIPAPVVPITPAPPVMSTSVSAIGINDHANLNLDRYGQAVTGRADKHQDARKTVFTAARRAIFTPVAYSATPAQVHAAIHAAAKVAGVSPNLAGGIAYLESIDGNPNARNGGSLGLFQMQRMTSDVVIARYGDRIAAALKESNDPKYQDMTQTLESHKAPTTAQYNQLILDPYFNSLLGTHLIKMNAEGYGLSVNNAGKMTEIYSMHLTGHLIPPGGTGTLTDLGMPQRNIDSNQFVLGASAANPDPTQTEAYASLQRHTQSWLDTFETADKKLGLYVSDAAPQSAGQDHGRHPVVRHSRMQGRLDHGVRL